MAETDEFPSPREPGPDRRDNVASAGLDPDTWEDLEEFRVEHRLKRSEATRRIIREHFAARERSAIQLLGSLAGVAYIAAMLWANTQVAAIVGGSYIVVTLLWASSPGIKRWIRGIVREE